MLKLNTPNSLPLITLSLCLSLALSANGLGLNLDSFLEEEDPQEDRLLVAATSNVPFNASQLGTIIGLVATAFVPTLVLGILGTIAFGGFVYAHKSEGDYDDPYSNYGSAYRTMGLDHIDWEKLSMVDWLAVGEETYRKFDPSSMECQKRVICELHQNANEFGPVAARMINLFGYLKYLDLFGLPDMIKWLTKNYQDAADRGRSLNKDCRDIFPFCEFSIKSLHDKYFGNEI